MQKVMAWCSCPEYTTSHTPAHVPHAIGPGVIMNPVSRILVATDLSENAVAALHAAVELAELSEAELWIVHVVPGADPGQAKALGEIQKKIEARAYDELRKAASKFKKSPVKCQTLVESGDVVARIQELAASLKIDVVVAGTRGHGSDDLRSIGGVAERLAQSASTDVLLVRPDHSEFARICVAVDFSELSVMAMERAGALARLFGAKKLGLLHVLHLPDEYWLTGLSEKDSLRKLREFAHEHMGECKGKAKLGDLKLEEVYEEGSPGAALAKMVKARKADLLVMGSHGRTTVSSAVVGSVAAKTIRSVPASLWIETDPKFKLSFLRALGKIMGLVTD